MNEIMASLLDNLFTIWCCVAIGVLGYFIMRTYTNIWPKDSKFTTFLLHYVYKLVWPIALLIGVIKKKMSKK